MAVAKPSPLTRLGIDLVALVVLMIIAHFREGDLELDHSATGDPASAAPVTGFGAGADPSP
jgi:hypothetical protein